MRRFRLAKTAYSRDVAMTVPLIYGGVSRESACAGRKNSQTSGGILRTAGELQANGRPLADRARNRPRGPVHEETVADRLGNLRKASRGRRPSTVQVLTRRSPVEPLRRSVCRRVGDRCGRRDLPPSEPMTEWSAAGHGEHVENARNQVQHANRRDHQYQSLRLDVS
jgi:hypothetical protein